MGSEKELRGWRRTMGASGAPIPASAPTGARVSGGWPRWCRRRRHVSRMCATKTYRSVDGTMKNTSHGCPYEYDSESMLWSVRRVCTLMRHMRQPVLLVRHCFRARGSVYVLCASPDLQNGAACGRKRGRARSGSQAVRVALMMMCPEPCPLCALVMALVLPRAGLLRDWLASPRRVTKPPEADTRGSEHVRRGRLTAVPAPLGAPKIRAQHGNRQPNPRT